MIGMLLAMLAMLFQNQSFLVVFGILFAVVIELFANRAFELDSIILWHRGG